MKREGTFSPELTRNYLRQLIEALVYLKSKSIIHRDLKLANLFVKKDGFIKLGDFGLACKHENPNRRRKSVCGTPNYIAPEMVAGEGHSFPVDVWAIGILLFAMLIGKPPFETSNLKMTYNRIQNCMYVFPSDKHIDTCAKVLIQSILTKNPSKRPSLEDIIKTEFFRQDSEQTGGSLAEEDIHHTKLKKESSPKSNLKKQVSSDKNESEPTKIVPEKNESRSKKVKGSEQEEIGEKPTQRKSSYKYSWGSNKTKEEIDEKSPRQSEKPEDQHKNQEIPKKLERQTIPKKFFSNETKEKQPPDSHHRHTVHFARQHIPSPLKESSREPPPQNDNEPAFLKRLMNHMSSAVHHDPLGENPKVDSGSKLSSSAVQAQSTSFPRKSSAYSFKPRDLGLVKEVAKDSKPFPHLPLSSLVTNQYMDDSTMNDRAEAGDPPSGHPSRRITAFDILKNTSKLNSAKNSVNHGQTSPGRLLSKQQQIVSKETFESTGRLITRQERERIENQKIRDISSSSAASNQKKLFFQRMISNNEGAKEASIRVDERVRESGSQSKEKKQISNDFNSKNIHSKTSTTETEKFKKAISLRGLGVMDTKILKPSTTENQFRRQTTLNSDANESDERPSSTQPNLKVRPLWHREEAADEETLDPKDLIRKWIDHSAKYGLVFIMNSGTLGILFNDSSKILFNLHSE